MKETFSSSLKANNSLKINPQNTPKLTTERNMPKTIRKKFYKKGR